MSGVTGLPDEHPSIITNSIAVIKTARFLKFMRTRPPEFLCNAYLIIFVLLKLSPEIYQDTAYALLFNSN
jgi:hypothetical protein